MRPVFLRDTAWIYCDQCFCTTLRGYSANSVSAQHLRGYSANSVSARYCEDIVRQVFLRDTARI